MAGGVAGGRAVRAGGGRGRRRPARPAGSGGGATAGSRWRWPRSCGRRVPAHPGRRGPLAAAPAAGQHRAGHRRRCACGPSERHLDGRPGQAVLLGALAGLTRPEAWPFLVLYAAWLLWRAPRRWWVLRARAAPRCRCCGSAATGWSPATPLAGPRRRRCCWGTAGAAAGARRWTTRGLVMVPVAVWVAAAVAWCGRRTARRLAPALLAGAALVWAAEVVVMAGAVRLRGDRPVLRAGRRPCCACWPGWRSGGRSRRRGRCCCAARSRSRWSPPACRSRAPRVAWLPLQLAAAAERSAYEARPRTPSWPPLGGRDGLLACGTSSDRHHPARRRGPTRTGLAARPAAGGVRHILDNGPGTTIAQRGSALDIGPAQRPPGEVVLVRQQRALGRVRRVLLGRSPRGKSRLECAR